MNGKLKNCRYSLKKSLVKMRENPISQGFCQIYSFRDVNGGPPSIIDTFHHIRQTGGVCTYELAMLNVGLDYVV